MVFLPEIGALALALWCLALALAATVVIEALINSMGGVPVIGRVIKAVLSPVAHALSWAAGKLEHGIDALIGATWHALARLFDLGLREWVSLANVVAQVAHIVGHTLYVNTGLRSLVHRLEKLFHGIEHGVKDLIRKWHGIEHRLDALERKIAKGIGHDLRLHIKALERGLDHVRRKTIPGLKEVDQYLDRRIDNLTDWLKGEVSIPGLGTLAGIVAAAVAALGLNWLGCRDGASRVGRSGCNLWDDLGDVFGLLAAAAIALEFETFVHDAQAATEATVSAVKDASGLG